MKALFRIFDRSTDDAQKRAVLTALSAATRVPSQGKYSNELLATTVTDATRIVEFLTERAKSESYELLQHMEHKFLYDYFRAKGLTEPENWFGCQAEAKAKALVSAILKFRDEINTDDRFVRYKVLVGFESVYPRHWTEQVVDYEHDKEYRDGEANRYIDLIDSTNEDEWLGLIERCAHTKSNDGATFPPFVEFIQNLTARKPEIAGRFLEKASHELRGFLTAFLDGFSQSERRDIYLQTLETELDVAKNLTGIAIHLRYGDITNSEYVSRLLKRAIDIDDSTGVLSCLLIAIKHYGTEKIANADIFVRDALVFLNNHKEVRWVWQAWFLDKDTKFYEQLTPEITSLILKNLNYVLKIDFRVELILTRIAEHQPEAVWDYFGSRFARETEGVDDGEDDFEAIPFEFHGLAKEFAKNPQLAIKKGLSWYSYDRKQFEFRGGRLISIAFPDCIPEFAVAIAELIKNGSDVEADFALDIIRNYRGQASTYVALKEIVSKFPEDARKMSAVRMCIDNTGVVTGEFGFAEALRTKRESLKEWLTDERTAVQAFAKKHIAELDLMITAEQRRAESSSEMRKRDYDEEDSGNDSSDNDEIDYGAPVA